MASTRSPAQILKVNTPGYLICKLSVYMTLENVFRFLVLLCRYGFEKFAVLCIEMHVVRGKYLGCARRGMSRTRGKGIKGF